MQQKLSAVLILVLALFSACKKSNSTQTPEPEKPQVSMRYTDLSGKILTQPNTAFHIDLDQDGNTDINVKIESTAETSTQLYRLKYAVSTGLGNYLLVDGNEQTPSFNTNQQIPLGNTSTHQWLDGVSISLADKVTTGSGAVYWEGNWKQSRHLYLPIMLVRKPGKYLGWLELSIDTEKQTIELFKSAVSTVPEKPVNTGG